MKKTCIQCGKEFEITDSEISFFEGRGLELPKRCSDCRKANKRNKAKRYHGRKKGDGKYGQEEKRPHYRDGNRESSQDRSKEAERSARVEDIMRETPATGEVKKGFFAGILNGIRSIFGSGK